MLYLAATPQVGTQILDSWVAVHETVKVHCLNLKTRMHQPVSHRARLQVPLVRESTELANCQFFVAGAIVFRLVTTLEAYLRTSGESVCPRRQERRPTNYWEDTSWSPKSQCVYGPENEIAAMAFFRKWRSFNKKQYSCKCNGMAGFRGTRLLIEGL